MDRLLWWLWTRPRPLAWDFKIPQPIWNWWTERLANSAHKYAGRYPG